MKTLPLIFIALLVAIGVVNFSPKDNTLNDFEIPSVQLMALANSNESSYFDYKEKLSIYLVYQVITHCHYENIDINDDFSSKIFDEYIERLDYAKRYFLESDIKELEKYRYQIDDQIKSMSVEFVEKATEKIIQRQNEAEKYYNEAISGSFNFKINENIETDPKKLKYAKNSDILKDNWRKITKLAVLEKVSDLIDIQETAIEKKDTTYKQKSQEEMIKDAVKSVKENYDDWMERLRKIKNDDWMTLYINAIINCCDPHSEFLPPDDKENFDIQMSGKFEGIGATLQNKMGQTKVINIIPGSASWQQGELEVNDIILKVGQGDEEPTDITNMTLDEAVKLIRGKKGSTVKLTVKKLDGSIKIIPIVRDVVIIEETYAKSSILTSPNNDTKIGYIYLPKFYADFNDKDGRFCSKDVEEEIKKLKADKVDGIVFDLRNNGGGSLNDVIKMSGLFVNSGPIVQVKDRDNNIKAHNSFSFFKDYDGPLVVLINGSSASASEIFAAAMQDYNRAIIMGGNSSFGKGTVQSFYDLDNLINDNNDLKPLGVVKITIQKFYRINGGTTQLKGVIPDIIMPDNYKYIETGEKEDKHALKYDVIQKAKYNEETPKYNRQTVINNSLARIKANPIFKQIDENALRLKHKNEDSQYSLNLDKYRKHLNNIKEEAKKYSNLGKEKTNITASFVNADKIACSNDSTKNKRFTEWFSDLEKDIYISEAMNVINDMK
ncbi:MAG: carboxy terminal-processing peptidase [Bacteroidales bacterium]|nr:carboxy terminal-processing peptidase [Bacteroidales bacterium]